MQGGPATETHFCHYEIITGQPNAARRVGARVWWSKRRQFTPAGGGGGPGGPLLLFDFPVATPSQISLQHKRRQKRGLRAQLENHDTDAAYPKDNWLGAFDFIQLLRAISYIVQRFSRKSRLCTLDYAVTSTDCFHPTSLAVAYAAGRPLSHLARLAPTSKIITLKCSISGIFKECKHALTYPFIHPVLALQTMRVEQTTIPYYFPPVQR